MPIIRSFEEYSGIYKRIINTMEIDEKSISGEQSFYNGTSLKHPLVFNDEFKEDGNSIYINRDYYESNKEEIEALVEDTLKTTTKDTVQLKSRDLITDRILKAISTNNNIKKVILHFLKPLCKEQVDMLMSGAVKNLECAMYFKNNNKRLLQDYTPGVVINNFLHVSGVVLEYFGGNIVRLEINNVLTNGQLKYLKQLFDKFPQKTVIIDCKNQKQVKEIMDIVKCKQKIIKKQNEYGIDDYIFFENNYDNILVEVSFNTWTPSRRLREKEEILNMIINEVKSQDLSPLEKYMYLYNIVKLFKEYKEVPKGTELMHSRKSSFTLFNDYMVCVGYSTFLEELVTRLDDPNILIAEYGCEIKDPKGRNGGHSRCLVKIKDDNYQIDGVYISDPTWDSVKYYETFLDENEKLVQDLNSPTAHFDFYNHFLITKDEVDDENKKRISPDITDVLFHNDPAFNIDKIPINLYSDAVEVIKKLNRKVEMNLEQVHDEFVNMNQPPISGSTIFAAITNLYSKIYCSDRETIHQAADESLYYNQLFQSTKFNTTKDKFNIHLVKKIDLFSN